MRAARSTIAIIAVAGASVLAVATPRSVQAQEAGADLPIERWEGELASDDPPRQVGAARAIAAAGPAAVEAIPALLGAIERTWDPEVVRESTRAIAAMGDAAVPLLVAELEAGSSFEAPAVLAALAELGPKARDAVPVLVELLEVHGQSAAQTLGRIGPEAVEPLVGVLRDASAPVTAREAATLALAWMDQPVAEAYPLVLAHLEPGRDRGLRTSAAYALGRMGASPERILADVERHLADESDEAVLRFLVQSLLFAGRQGVARLLELAAGDDWARSVPAQMVLEEDPEDEALSSLRDALGSDAPAVRRAAVSLIARMGDAAAPAIDDLIGLLPAEDDVVGLAAARALGGAGARAVERLAAVVASRAHPRVARVRACDALGQIGEAAAPAVPTLRALLDDATAPGLRLAVVRTLGAIGRPAQNTAERLLEILRLEKGPRADLELRDAAAEALIAIGAEASLEVRDLFASDDERLRRWASDVVRRLREKSPPTPRGRIIIGPISYPAAVSRARAIDLAELREGLVVALQVRGFAVARESALPPRRIAFEEHPLERLRARAPGATAVVELVATEPPTLVIAGGVARETRTVETPAAGIDVPALLALVLPHIAKLGPDEVGRGLPAVAGTVDLDRLRSAERLDWDMGQRLVELDGRLSRLGLGDTHVTTLLDLAVISTLHACYGWKTDEITARRHFGRAAFFAAWAARHPDSEQRGLVERVRAELRVLRRHFGEGVAEPLPDEPLLPETASVRRMAVELSFDDTVTAPPFRTLFDFLVRRVHTLYIRGAEDRRLELFETGNRVEVGLLWSKWGSFAPSFDAAMYTTSHAGFGPCLGDLAAVARPLGFEALFEQLQESFRALGEGANIWDLLDNAGRRRRERDDRLEAQESLALLHVARVLEDEARRSSERFDADPGLALEDVFDELVRRYQEIVLIQRERFIDLGWSTHVDSVDALVTRYGSDRVAVRRSWPGLDDIEPFASAYQRQIAERAKDVRAAFRERRYAEALELAQPLLDRFGHQEAAIDTKTGFFHIYARAGRAGDGIERFMRLNPTSFAKDHFRDEVLSWTEGRPERFRGYFEKNTASAQDYITRARFALRLRDWDRLLETTRAYHYTPRHEVILALEAVGELVTEGSSRARWQKLESALGTLQRNQSAMTYAGIRHWDPILEEELGESEELASDWAKLKERLHWEDWVALSRARVALRGAPTREEVVSVVDVCDAIAAARVGDEQLSRNGLFLEAVELGHFALACLILQETDGLAAPDPVDSAIVTRVKRLVSHSRAFLAAYSNLRSPWSHLPSWFLYYLVRMGVPPDRIARFAAALPDPPALLASDHRSPLFALAAGSPGVMEKVLEGAKGSDANMNLMDVAIPEIDEGALFASAFAEGNDACAFEVALGQALRRQSLGLLRHYLADDEPGRAWVRRNAPSLAVERRWLAELADPPGEAIATAKAAREAPLPGTVPGLVEYLAGEHASPAR